MILHPLRLCSRFNVCSSSLNVALHVALIAIPLYLAFWLRFNGTIPEWEKYLFVQTLPWLVLIRGLSLFIARVCDAPTQFSGAWDTRVRYILAAALLSTFIFYFLIHWRFHIKNYPRSIFIIDMILFVFFMVGAGLARKAYVKRGQLHKLDAQKTNDRRLESGTVFYSYELGLMLVASTGILIMFIAKQDIQLPYDNTNPIIYDNDETIDAYTDEYLMAMASAGSISLVGIITSSPVAPHNEHVTEADYERMVVQRNEGVIHARNSGFSNIPDPVRGPRGHLQKPASGKIEDTLPLAAEGSYLIVRQAQKTLPEKPLVIVMGGPLTIAADAYLLDNSIADKVIVSWIGGREYDMVDYNGYEDPWAAYIVLQKLRLVQFPAWSMGSQAAPSVPKVKLTELPNSTVRQWMLDKQHHTGLPDERDVDAAPATVLMQRKFVLQAKRVSFSHWITQSGRELPAFKEDPKGRSLVITRANKHVATKEWWRTLKNPAAWGRNAL